MKFHQGYGPQVLVVSTSQGKAFGVPIDPGGQLPLGPRQVAGRLAAFRAAGGGGAAGARSGGRSPGVEGDVSLGAGSGDPGGSNPCLLEGGCPIPGLVGNSRYWNKQGWMNLGSTLYFREIIRLDGQPATFLGCLGLRAYISGRPHESESFLVVPSLTHQLSFQQGI